MEGSEQGTMDGETQVKRPAGRSHKALRSRPQPRTHAAAPIATSAEVFTGPSDPRLGKTGYTRIPA